MDLTEKFKFNSDERISGTWIVTLADDKTASERPIGNIKSGGYAPNLETRNRNFQSCGRNQVDKSIVIKTEPQATIKIEDLNKENIKIAFLSKDLTTIVQPVLSAVACDALNIANAPLDRIYKIKKAGVEVLNLTSLILKVGATTLVEGTDYVISSKRFASVRFKINQSAPVTVEASADQTTVTPSELGSGQPFKGYARMYYYPTSPTQDQACDAEMVLEGACVATSQSSLEVTVDNDSELDLLLTFSGFAKLTDLRKLA